MDSTNMVKEVMMVVVVTIDRHDSYVLLKE